jgi:hypothetical protein
MWGQSKLEASGSKDMRPKEEKIKKGEGWSRGSLDDGKHPSKCKWLWFCQFLQTYAALLVLSQITKKGEIVANMAPFAICSS